MKVVCPHCHCSTDSGTAGGGAVVCLSCGSRFGDQQSTTLDWNRATAGIRIGKFQLLREIGVGSFGRVFQARDVELDRMVAVKVPRADGPYGWSVDDSRFVREAQSLAQLRHPSIVAVHEVGEHEGVRYLVEDYVEGVTLADLLTARRLSTRESAELLRGVAIALQYAHEHGVVHRDVKPSNIILGPGLEPHLMDFGVAKRDAPALTLTHDGEVIGTPAYMSPEQARGEGHRADGRVDVYSVGVMFYELLTGELPFRGNPRMVMHQVLNAEPRPPRELSEHVPRDAETVCLKAMAKEPGRRYATAGALADDLGRFVRGEPIRARPTGRAERAWRWSRRNPAVAGLMAAVLGLLAALAGGATAYGLQQRRLAIEQTALAAARTTFGLEKERESARLAGMHRRAQSDLYRALVTGAAAVRTAREPGYRARAWEALKRAAALDVPERSPDEIRAEAVACMGDWVGLDAVDGTGLEPRGAPRVPLWFVPLVDPAQARSPRAPFAITPDGRYAVLPHPGRPQVVVVGADGKQVAAAPTPLGMVHSLALNADGTLLVGGCEEGTAIWSLPALAQVMAARGTAVHSVDVHRAGLVATANSGERIEVWSIASHRLIVSLQTRAPSGELQVRFSADGQHLLALTPAGVIGAWQVTATSEKRYLGSHAGGVPGVAYSPDSRFVASCSKDGTVRVWGASSGALIHRLGRPHALPGARPVQTVAFNPSGTLLAAGTFAGKVTLWEPESGREVAAAEVPWPESRGLWRVRFDGRGERLLAAGSGGLAAWDVKTGPAGVALERVELPPLSDGDAHFRDVAVSPAGTHVAFLDVAARNVGVYDVGSGAVERLPFVSPGSLGQLNFDPRGELLTFGTPARAIGLWDVRRRTVARVTGTQFSSPLAAVTRDFRWLATKSPNNRLVIYDLREDREVVHLPVEESEIWWADWSPDGTRVALGLANGDVVVWDLASMRAGLAGLGIEVASTAVQ